MHERIAEGALDAETDVGNDGKTEVFATLLVERFEVLHQQMLLGFGLQFRQALVERGNELSLSHINQNALEVWNLIMSWTLQSM